MFLTYDLSAEILILGERPKGVFRPTIRTIPYSQITGALRYYLEDTELHAVGFFINDPEVDLMVFSPREQIENTSKLPITVEVLKNPLGRIIISGYNGIEDFPSKFTLPLGSMKSKGFGRCNLFNKKEIKTKESKGELKTRIPIDVLPRFGITFETKSRIVYGYLPISRGLNEPPIYQKSLFEGSEVNGPEILLRGEKDGRNR